jgi:hypothetical protein
MWQDQGLLAHPHIYRVYPKYLPTSRLTVKLARCSIRTVHRLESGRACWVCCDLIGETGGGGCLEVFLAGFQRPGRCHYEAENRHLEYIKTSEFASLVQLTSLWVGRYVIMEMILSILMI